MTFGERDLLETWYGGRPPALTLRLLERAYALATGMRRGLYRIGLLPRTRLPVPVVVVGNIVAGGTGKTPLTIALVEALRARGFRPGVVSRGYGVRRSDPVLVDAHADPSAAGDEPCLIARATGAPVAVGADRVAAARLLLAAPGAPDVLVADDGLQHYRLFRDVEICVIDGERRFGNGRLLPAGPLREPVGRAERCDFRITNGGIALPGETAMTLIGDEAVGLSAPRARCPLSAFAKTRAHAVAGIGNPGRFFAQLRAAGIAVTEHPFGDHHAFSATDLSFDDDLPVLMTEKDAVKCAAFADARCWSVPVRAVVAERFFDVLAERLRPGT
jgi:tetraacyldisaccharide 4'-kinase